MVVVTVLQVLGVKTENRATGRSVKAAKHEHLFLVNPKPGRLGDADRRELRCTRWSLSATLIIDSHFTGVKVSHSELVSFLSPLLRLLIVWSFRQRALGVARQCVPCGPALLTRFTTVGACFLRCAAAGGSFGCSLATELIAAGCQDVGMMA